MRVDTPTGGRSEPTRNQTKSRLSPTCWRFWRCPDELSTPTRWAVRPPPPATTTTFATVPTSRFTSVQVSPKGVFESRCDTSARPRRKPNVLGAGCGLPERPDPRPPRSDTPDYPYRHNHCWNNQPLHLSPSPSRWSGFRGAHAPPKHERLTGRCVSASCRTGTTWMPTSPCWSWIPSTHTEPTACVKPLLW